MDWFTHVYEKMKCLIKKTVTNNWNIRILRYYGIQENPRFFTPGSWRTSWQLSKVVIQLQRCMQRNGMAIQLWRRPTLVRVNWLLEPNYDVINAAPFWEVRNNVSSFGMFWNDQPVLTVWNFDDFDAIGTCQMTFRCHWDTCHAWELQGNSSWDLRTSESSLLSPLLCVRQPWKNNTSFQMSHRYLPAISPG